MKREELRRKIIRKIEGYLEGKVAREDAAAWAISKIKSTVFTSGDAVLEDALTALAGLHDEDERFSTPKEDLTSLLPALKGLTPHSVTIVST